MHSPLPISILVPAFTLSILPLHQASLAKTPPRLDTDLYASLCRLGVHVLTDNTAPSRAYLDFRHSIATDDTIPHLLTIPIRLTVDLRASRLSDSACELLATSKNVDEIIIGNSQISERGIAYLANSTTISSLTISSVHDSRNPTNVVRAVTPATVRLLSRMPSLQSLKLPGTVDDQIAFLLAASSSLQSLEFENCTASTTGWDAIASMTALTRLSTLSALRLDDARFFKLCALPLLRELRIGHAPLLRGNHFSRRAKHYGIESLWLAAPHVTDDFLAGLASLPNLTTLRIDARAFTPRNVATLAAITSLKGVTISLTEDVSGKALTQALNDMPSIEYLDIHYAHPNAAALETLSWLPQLKAATLRNGVFSRALADDLSKCASLRSLALWQCTIENGAIAALASQRHLTFLAIIGSASPATELAALISVQPSLAVHSEYTPDLGFTCDVIYDTSIVTLLAPDGPAAKAGIKLGDRIDAINDVAMSSTDSRSRVMCRVPLGQGIKVAFTRHNVSDTVLVPCPSRETDP